MNTSKRKAASKSSVRFKDLKSKKNPKGGSGPGDTGPEEIKITALGSATGGSGAGKIKFKEF
jgi:hypothetical protein